MIGSTPDPATGELVTYQLVDGTAMIVMDDGKANALSLEMLSALNQALDRAASDGAVVVLTGRQGIFSGGFDLKVLGAGGPDAAVMLEQGFLLALRLLEHPAPVIIACNGHAVAMGRNRSRGSRYLARIEIGQGHNRIGRSSLTNANEALH